MRSAMSPKCHVPKSTRHPESVPLGWKPRPPTTRIRELSTLIEPLAHQRGDPLPNQMPLFGFLLLCCPLAQLIRCFVFLLIRHCSAFSLFCWFAVTKQQAESRCKSPQIQECQWTSNVTRLGVLPETCDPSSDLLLEGINPTKLLSTISQFPPPVLGSTHEITPNSFAEPGPLAIEL